MGAVWFRYRTELRRRWRPWFVLALLVMLGSGVVIAALAGARRTDSAYSRFLVTQRADDVLIVNGSGFLGFADLDPAQVAALPGVAESSIAKVAQIRTVQHGRHGAMTFEPISGVSDPANRFSSTIDRPKILEGRRPDPSAPDEIAPSFGIAERLDAHVGDNVRVQFLAAGEGPLSPEHGPTVPLKVVGISAAPGDFPPITGNAVLRLTPAFQQRYGASLLETDAIALRLEDGARAVPAFKAAVEHLAGGRTVQFLTQSTNSAEVQRSLHVQAVALYLLAGLAGLIALLVIGQAVTRQAYLESDDDSTLAALGLTRTQLAGLAGLRLLLIAGVGVVLALLLAIALSPLTPIGLAAKAEPDPGLSVDGLVLGVGALLTVVFVAVVGIGAAIRAARAPRAAAAARRPSKVVGGLAAAGAPVTAVVGVRMAVTRGRGRGAVPVWSTLAGGVLAIATVIAAAGFGTSLDHLLATPRLYGVGWTVTAGSPFFQDLTGYVLPELRKDAAVRGISGGTYTEVELDGQLRVTALATQPIVGDVTPTVLEGHAPASPDEILLGSETIDRLGTSVGASVPVAVGPRHARFRIVGRGVLPDLEGTGGLGRGAALTYDGLRRVVPDAPQNFFLLRLRRGVDASATSDRIEERLRAPGLVDRHPSAPTDLVNFGRVDNLPFVIAGLLVVLATATLAHTLVSQVRRRRRDLAVLKTLGFARRQVMATTAWQASTLAAAALLIGIPVGLLLGRLAWRAFTDELGAVYEARLAWLPVILLVPAALLLANLVAALPARAAARTRPAVVLRSE